MADITMCKGEMCAKKETCYRHKAHVSEFQSWFVAPPISMLTGECKYFWEIIDGNKK